MKTIFKGFTLVEILVITGITTAIIAISLKLFFSTSSFWQKDSHQLLTSQAIMRFFKHLEQEVKNANIQISFSQDGEIKIPDNNSSARVVVSDGGSRLFFQCFLQGNPKKFYSCEYRLERQSNGLSNLVFSKKNHGYPGLKEINEKVLLDLVRDLSFSPGASDRVLSCFIRISDPKNPVQPTLEAKSQIPLQIPVEINP